MKMNKIVMSLVLSCGIAGFANAASQGSGTVKIFGEIVDAPCGISPETAKQEVDLGKISNVALKDGGKSVPQGFDIELTQCDTSTLKNVTVTFNGAASSADPDLFGINGTASGASVVITDLASNIIKRGTPTSDLPINDGKNTLRFSTYLKGDGASTPIVPGDFSTIADFVLEYK